MRADWSEEQGYTGGAVNAFAETPDGYLWIGAENGLVRFDGLTFRMFNHANTSALPASGVLALATGGDGVLWVVMKNTDLFRYRGGVFEAFGGESLTTAFAPGSRGDLLLARAGGAWRYSGGKMAPVPVAAGFGGSLIMSVAEGDDGTVWMGTRDQGVFGIRNGDGFYLRGLPDTKVNCLLAGAAGSLWIGTDHGLAKWDGKEVTLNGMPAALRTTAITAIARDHDSNLWLATARGLMRLSAEGVLAQEGLTDDKAAPATALFEDRESNIWVGRMQGLERLRDRAFLSYPPLNAGDGTDSGPVYADPSGRAWFAPAMGGLFWLKDAERGQVKEAGLSRDVVYSIDGAEGELWIGRQRGGLTHLRRHDASWTAETFTAADGLAEGPVYVVRRCRDGTVWAGTLNGGVSRIRDGKVTTYTVASGLPSNSISAIEEGADGTMWFATASGLGVLSKNVWRVYASAEGLPPARINCLFEDPFGVLWIGTDAGLVFLRNGRVQLSRQSGDSLLEEILGIASDSRGGLWIATSKHLVRGERSLLLDEAGGAARLREFGPEDGIPAPEGVRRARSVVRDAAGRIWFSLRRGISVIEPSRLSFSSLPAIVHVESVSADGSPIEGLAPLKIPASRVRIRFDYLALSLSAPERVRYRFRMDGVDHDWSDPTSARDTQYMNLHPGPYRFRVIASNSAGSWNSAEADVGLEIVPAFWQTWTFLGLAALACALAALSMYRLHVLRLTKELKIGFQERLDERTRIAQELHDTLLQGLLATSMQLHAAVLASGPDSPAAPQFTRVITMLQQVIDESRDALRGLRGPALRCDDLETAFSRVREELSAPESTAFRIIVNGPSQPLNPLIRDQVYRICREGLSNAFRHSGASVVEIEIEYGNSDLRVTVRDNGWGIDERVLRLGRDGHWGLIGMRECAERIGALLKVSSRPGAGTELELTAPGQIAFLKPPSAQPPRWLHWRPWKRPKPEEHIGKARKIFHRSNS